MNKKKKASRLKHRKNRERMKNLIRVSQLKAKPKKVAVLEEIETDAPITAETVKIPAAKKTPKKSTTKKTTAKKTTAKKTPKKSTTKKTTAKKSAKKKTATK